MPVVCRPAVAVPEYVVTQEETVQLGRRLHGEHPQFDVILRLLQHTGIRSRHLIAPIEEVMEHPGLEARNNRYEQEARHRLPPVIAEALSNADLAPQDIDATILVSCTGFLMPSLTAWMINDLGFRPDMRQFPIAQLGCAAGGAAIGLAHDLCIARTGTNVLIVSCEFCSLVYQPTDHSIGALLSAGLFGDGIAAAVVRGTGGTGPRLEASGSHLIPGTTDWIAYRIKETGFHFQLDKRVPDAVAPAIGPAVTAFTTHHGWDITNLDYYLVHAGGIRILDNFADHLHLSRDRLTESYAAITQHGNIASALILDSLHRLFTNPPRPGARGLIMAFGPGITAQFSLATWTESEC